MEMIRFVLKRRLINTLQNARNQGRYMQVKSNYES